MQRCIELAEKGSGSVAPNPMVGSVIVCDGKIIGEGYHRSYGGPHAEVHAIQSVADKSMLKRSTMYVSLEPCSHFGKTPPCADLIIEHQVPHVVVGTVDPFAKVSGRGIIKMRDAGIHVEVGILESACNHLNRRFFTFHSKKRPFVILKWAETMDGFIDMDRNEANYGMPTWITNAACRVLVHKQRSKEQAILVGTNTALKDNPSLTVREWNGPQPLRVVPDFSHRLTSELKLLKADGNTLVVTDENQYHLNVPTLKSPKETWIDSLFSKLYTDNIQSLIVEGGAHMIQTFIDLEVWDHAYVYVGDQHFGSGVSAPHINARPHRKQIIGNSMLYIYKNQE